jgi:geranylgeranyl reductase family protein
MPEKSHKPEYDVIIVGASVAGCRTALTLTEKGVRVRLLDKTEFPRWKPCAGGITLKARSYLPDPLFDLVDCSVHGAYLTFGPEYVTHIRSENPMGWLVHRESFDEAHLELVRSQPTVDVALGVTVRGVVEHDEGVIVETTDGEIRARVLVGADGARSVVSKSLPGHDERLMGFAYEGEASVTERGLNEETFFDFRAFPHGYGWVFPKKDHYSIGGFVYGRKLPDVKRLYEEFCAEAECLGDVQTYRARGHPVSLGGDLRRLNSRRIVLAGEAGGLVDPLTGEGIYYALRSGHLAGEAVARFLNHGDSFDSYGDQVRDEIQEGFRSARTLATFLYDHPGVAFHLLLRNSLTCRWFTEIGAGTKSYRGIVHRLLKKSPLLPFHAGLSKRQDIEVEIPAELSRDRFSDRSHSPGSIP